jgi:hypothetical protein
MVIYSPKMEGGMKIKGWKSIVGAILVGFSAVMEYSGMHGQSELIKYLGLSLLGLGIAHKIEKAGK